jgi:hypothetical protein
MKASKKRTTTRKMGKSNGRSKKTSGTRKLNKNEVKGMAGGFDFSKLGAFFIKELMEYGPRIAGDAMNHDWKNKK